jgi:hypothetical protein
MPVPCIFSVWHLIHFGKVCILFGFLVVTAWHVLRCGWKRQTPDMESSCEYTELASLHNQKGWCCMATFSFSIVKLKLMFTYSSFATSHTVNHWSECNKATTVLTFYQSVRWIASWNSGHCTMVFYNFLEQWPVEILVVTVTSVFPHCNFCKCNLAFVISAYVFLTKLLINI